MHNFILPTQLKQPRGYIVYSAQKDQVIDLAPKRLAKMRRESEIDYNTRYNPDRFLKALNSELF